MNPFLAHGVLFVPDDSLVHLMTALQMVRKNEQYYGEIHYRTIKGASVQNGALRVAQGWIREYFQTYVKSCPFKAFIVEYGPNRAFPYPGDTGYEDHLLKSLLASLKGGIAWSYPRETLLRLRIVHDDTDSELDRDAAMALSGQLQTQWNTRKVELARSVPRLRVRAAEFVDSNPKNVGTERWPESEFIQLCDLMLGAVFDALQLKPLPEKMHGRRELSKSVLGVLGDTVRVPWLQQVPVHRKFSVSLYPDKFGFAYPAALRKARCVTPMDIPRLPGF